MKHEAEEQLLKTFNGQLKGMPAVAKTMVHQYQTSAIVLAIVFGILFLVALIGTIWLAIFFYKKFENGPKFNSYDFTCGMTVFGGGVISVVLLFCTVLNIVHACSPITSILSSILGH